MSRLLDGYRRKVDGIELGAKRVAVETRRGEKRHGAGEAAEPGDSEQGVDHVAGLGTLGMQTRGTNDGGRRVRRRVREAVYTQ